MTAAAAGAPLTGRELEIAGLVAEGRTDRQVAELLFVSVRTVGAHLNHVYIKTGIRSRNELTADYLAGRFVELSEDPPVSSTAPPPRPVRLTIDLKPELHRKLSRWAADTAEALDIPRLTLADAVRAMIETMTEDVEPGAGTVVRLRLRLGREDSR